ncbi:hypothetical protein [Deinococcus soli (ex Cha et al. 2016)]|uniref:Uncharacterized protein n=2 Tax=Deinococcus soli (ex Cha et al. 2016) TaxID=1309411 RepID=A0ACC6KGY3_9DEIO|nr:hypothetical protein [Deinococcus soli (ex Cha et al. 2016)]MDR6219027.1 hypothetical protein [Deinococcus soli (ex Cha et al. 2016)]MDR6328824.1 hypothetical protein [Deinococcus soli (ex Cha et al. 2016)]MDR6751688.1 hypothetical protein [Deinococcus soli (ex Cha et al. 2016)]
MSRPAQASGGPSRGAPLESVRTMPQNFPLTAAFELTPADAETVLIRLNLPAGNDDVTQAYALVTAHQDQIIRAALDGSDLCEQTDCALEAIEDLLRAHHGLTARATLPTTGAL